MLSLNAESVDNALDHVQRHAGDTLHNVQWIVKDFASPQLRVLARHLPNLKQLTLEHLSFVEVNAFLTTVLVQNLTDPL